MLFLRCRRHFSIAVKHRPVQGWSADEADDNDDDTYQSFECHLRTRVHLVNRKTGKVLGGRSD